MLKSVFVTIGILLLIFLISFISLVNGISIDSISTKSVNIKELYLKYDKKLIFSIEKLEILDSKDEEESSFDLKWLQYSNTILNFFTTIELKDIIYANEHINVKYQNNLFTIKSNGIIVSLQQNIHNNTIDYQIQSNKIKDIKFINKFVELSVQMKELINHQFTFDYIQLENLSGKEKIANLDNFDITTLIAEAIIKKPKLAYEKYPKFSLEDIKIKLSNGTIDITLNKTNTENEISFQGAIQTDLENTNTTIKGELFYKELAIKTNTSIQNDTLSYQLSIKEFHDIKIFEEFIDIPEDIKKWAITRLKSDTIKIENINGKIYLQDFKVDLSTLRIDAILYDIIMDFNPNLAYPLEAKEVKISFDGKDMHFKFKNPISNDVDLKGSDAIIYDMFGDSGLLLRLQSQSPLNSTLVRAVKSYDVNIADELAIRQTKGKSDIKVKIDIPFDEKPTDIYVKITNKNSVISIKENLLSFTKFDFVYVDDKVILNDTILLYEKNNITIKNLNFNIENESLKTDIDIEKQNEYSLSLKNSSNLQSKIGRGVLSLNSITIPDISDVKNIKIPYNINFDDDIQLYFPTLDILYSKIKQSNHLAINDLNLLKPFFIPLNKIDIKKGTISLFTKEFEKINTDLFVKSGDKDQDLSYEFLLRSQLDLKQQKSKGSVLFKRLNIKDIIDINNTTVPYKVNYKDTISVYLPSLDIDFTQKDEINYLNLNSFEKLSKVITVMKENNITNGDIKVQTKDFKNIDAQLNIITHLVDIYYKNKKLPKLTLDAQIKNLQTISIKDPNDMIEASIDLEGSMRIDLKTDNLGIVYKSEDYNTTEEPPLKPKEPLEKCKNIILDLPTISTQLQNGFFQYNDNRIIYDRIKTYSKEDKVLFDLSRKKTDINLFINKENIALDAKEVGFEFLNTIAGKEITTGGKAYLNLHGSQCQPQGKSYLRNLNIKDAAILNNIFLVVNSAPAIINPLLILPNAFRFATDKFSLSEYEIKNGHFYFDFNRDKSIIKIPKMDIDGVHSSFKGKADIDLYNEKIQANIDIIFMKDYAKIISYIPLVNYIILGDEKRFSYSVDVDGNLTNPDVTTHMTTETLMAPVNMIKRVFLLPTLPFKETNSTNNDKN